jgi:translation initiation factor 4G
MSINRKDWTQRMDGLRESHELEKAALAQEHRSEMDSMTKRLRDAEQHHLDELDRVKYEHIKMDLSPPSGSFNRSLESGQAGFYPQGFAMPVQSSPYKYPQMYQNQDMPPQSPQPGYQPFAYIPGQYDPHAQPISRNSSPISEQRPASSIGQPQTPSMTPSISRTYTPQPNLNSTPSLAFPRPTRKSATIVIKRPDGEAIDVESFKPPAVSTPSSQARRPPTITPTPMSPSTVSTPQHARTSSASVGGKTPEQIRREFQELVIRRSSSG